MVRDVINEFGEYLVVAMSAKGWTRRDLAAAAGVGASVVSRYMTTKARPDRATAERLARALGVPFGDIAAFCGLVVSVGESPVLHAVPGNAGTAASRVDANREALIFQMRDVLDPRVLDAWDARQLAELRTVAIQIAASVDAIIG